MIIPRSEYPRPQFVRSDWLCLNGEWQFEIDAGDSGLERGLLRRELKERILVPFCPESPLSGIGNKDFMPIVWYRHTVTIPQSWSDQRVLLHFQAVDYDTTVWVNGELVGRHRGGFTPFTCDLDDIATSGNPITIVLRVRDDPRPSQPRGKQSQKYEDWDCFYTRTTGIWQTVWMEPVSLQCSLRRPRITPDVANSVFRLEQPITNTPPVCVCAPRFPIRMVSLPRLSVPLTWILLLGSICPSLLSVAVYGRRKTRICTTWTLRCSILPEILWIM